MLQDAVIAGRWTEAHGSLPSADDLDRLYVEFAPLQPRC